MGRKWWTVRRGFHSNGTLAVGCCVGLALVVACTPARYQGGGAADSAVPPPELPARFSVLSYNVAGLPQGISGSHPETNMQIISPRLNPYDIVLTQEDFDWWAAALWLLDFSHYHERLREKATHPYQSTVHPGPEEVGIYRGSRPLLVGDGLGTLSRFPFREGPRVPWSACFGDAFEGAADCFAMKGFSMSTVRLATGFDVDVYNLHVEAGGSARDQVLQAADITQIGDFIESHSAGRAVIVGGDTNLHTDPSHPDAEGDADTILWESLLHRLGLTDTCVETGCDEPGAIDKIAYRDGGNLDLWTYSHEFVPELFRDSSGNDLSDHEPLAVTFGWNRLDG